MGGDGGEPAGGDGGEKRQRGKGIGGELCAAACRAPSPSPCPS